MLLNMSCSNEHFQHLGWYEAKRCYSNGQPKMEGTIPITHIRLIYDDESDPEDDNPSDLDDGKLCIYC